MFAVTQIWKQANANCGYKLHIFQLPYLISHLVIRPYGSNISSKSRTLVDLLSLPIKREPSFALLDMIELP